MKKHHWEFPVVFFWWSSSAPEEPGLTRTIHDLEASDGDLSVQDRKPDGLLAIASIRRPSWVAFISRSRPELEISSSDRRYATGFANGVSARADLMNNPG